MDDQRHAATLTDEVLERDIARALDVDPSPEFVARVRTQIANEPTPSAWRFSRTTWIAGGAVAAAIVLAAVLARPNRAPASVSQTTLIARSLGEAVVVPYVASGFSRTIGGPPKGGRHVRIDNTVGPPEGGPRVQVLLDPRETQALRSLLASVRTNRVDLSPLLTATAPAPTELPPAGDLVIAPLAIEPLAPGDGAQGERQ
jgi:hypothetical protein